MAVDQEYDAKQSFENFALKYLQLREAGTFENVDQLAMLGEKYADWKDRVVLELGCGGGKPVLSYFADKGAHVWGVDLSDTMVETAKRNLPEGHFFQGDMSSVELPTAHFDLITSFYALFVLPMEKQFILFETMSRSLKSGGFAYFTLLNGNSTKSAEFSGFLNFAGHRFFYAHTTREKYIEFLRSLEFEIISCQDLHIGEESCLWILIQKK